MKDKVLTVQVREDVLEKWMNSSIEGGGSGGGEYLYFSFNWGEQTSNIVPFFSSVVRISQYSIWQPMAAITNPQTISLIDGCAIDLSMKIQSSEMGITSLVTIEDALISMVGKNYMALFKQMGFTPITKEQFYSLE